MLLALLLRLAAQTYGPQHLPPVADADDPLVDAAPIVPGLVVKLAYATGISTEALLTLRLGLSAPVYLAIGIHTVSRGRALPSRPRWSSPACSSSSTPATR